MGVTVVPIMSRAYYVYCLVCLVPVMSAAGSLDLIVCACLTVMGPNEAEKDDYYWCPMCCKSTTLCMIT